MQDNPDDDGVKKVALTDILSQSQIDHVVGLFNAHTDDLSLAAALKDYLGSPGMQHALLDKGLVSDYFAYWLLACKTEIMVNNIMDEGRRNMNN